MQIELGFNAGNGFRNQPVVWDSGRLVNPHICIIGMTGAGKSYNLKRRPLQKSLSSNSRNPNTGFRLFSPPPIPPDFTQMPP